MIKRAYRAVMCNPLFAYKSGSTFVQFYLLSFIATNGSAEEPFVKLATVAHMGALCAALRGVDALIDPMFRQLVAPLTDADKKAIASETSGVPTVTP